MKNRFTSACLLAAALFVSSAVIGQDTHGYWLYNQRVLIANLPPVTARDGSAPAVAQAALFILLSKSHISCEPGSQLTGVVDDSAASSLRSLSSWISGAYCYRNGSTFWGASNFVPNQAIRIEEVVASLAQDKPLLFEWKGELYVLYGAVYDEFVGSPNCCAYRASELLLIDPRYSDKRRLVVFNSPKDSVAEVEGMANVGLSEPHSQWGAKQPH